MNMQKAQADTIGEISYFLSGIGDHGLRQSNQGWLIHAPTRERLRDAFAALRDMIQANHADMFDMIHIDGTFQPSLCNTPNPNGRHALFRTIETRHVALCGEQRQPYANFMGMHDMQKRIIARGRVVVLLLENMDFMLAGSDNQTFPDGLTLCPTESEWRWLMQDMRGVAWICGTTIKNPVATNDPRRPLWGFFVTREVV